MTSETYILIFFGLCATFTILYTFREDLLEEKGKGNRKRFFLYALMCVFWPITLIFMAILVALTLAGIIKPNKNRKDL